jgi:heme-degrading monooxygenase HmoA
MPKLPWTSANLPPEEGGEHLAMASSLPLRRFSSTIRFMRFVMEIRGQLRTADGLVGYALWAKPFSRRYWTLSEWRDQDALDRFMRTKPHADVMRDLRPAMDPTTFVKWKLDSQAGPPTWEEALSRLEAEGSSP